MRVFNLATVRDYAGRHPDAAAGLMAWYRIACAARWHRFQDARASDPAVSAVGDRLVFNVNGNRHRVVVRVDWACGFLFIRFIGTHAEYDRINVLEV